MADSGLFNTDYLRQLQQQHDSGRHDHSVVMWELLMFALSDRHLNTPESFAHAPLIQKRPAIAGRSRFGSTIYAFNAACAAASRATGTRGPEHDT